MASTDENSSDSSEIDNSSAIEQAPRPRRSVFNRDLVILCLFLFSLIGYQVWSRISAPVPPEVALTEADPDVAEAITSARKLVLSRPRTADAWGHLGMTLQAHGFSSPAQACYAEAEKLDNSSAQWPYLRATCLKELGSNEVVPCLERAVKRRGQSFVPQLVLGENLLEQNQVDPAEKQFLAVLASDPKNARAHLDLGRAARARGDLRATVEHLEHSIAIESRIRESYDLLSSSLHALGEKTRADDVQREANLRSQKASWPDPYLDQVSEREVDLSAISRRANLLFGKGDTELALKMLEHAMLKRPESASAKAGFGRMLMLCNRPADAIPQLEDALRLDPNMSVPNFYLGAAFFQQGKDHEAVKAFRRSIELQPNHAEAHYELARVLYRQHDLEGATQSARESLRFNPNFARAAQALGVFLIEQGKHEDAVLYLTQAAALAPDDKETQRFLRAAQAKLIEQSDRH